MIKKSLFLSISLFILIFLLIGCDIFVKMNRDEFEDENWSGSGYISFTGYTDINSPTSLIVSPDNRNVYVVNNSDSVYCYERESESGWLHGDSFNNFFIDTGAMVNCVAISPDGRHVYLIDSSTSKIYWLSRSFEWGGGLSGNPGSDNIFVSTGLINQIIMAPDGKHIYISDGNKIYWLERNLETGELYGDPLIDFINIGAANYFAVSSDGKNIYAANMGSIYWLSRDFKTGALSYDPVTDFIVISTMGINCFTISLDGRYLYIAQTGLPFIIGSLKRDMKTGACSNYKNQFLNDNNIDWITISPDGKNIYAINNVNNEIRWYIRDINTGDLFENNFFTSPGYLNGPNCIVITPDGKNAYITAHTGGSANMGGIVFFSRDI
ncbi:MAG: PD40 domain-containing protein [Spirochaetes bacterium]|nr:PD40 domain-containing protein [Spirochaetota bacterium]